MSAQSYRLAETRLGDTLQAVALRELGDASRWAELVPLNNLAPPYIVDHLADLEDEEDPTRVIIAGQDVKVPAPAPSATGVADRNDVYGVDLLLQDGELGTTVDGDLALVRGPDNLVQALGNRLATRRRELLMHPEYGNRMFELVGEGGSGANLTLAAAYAKAAALADPRTAGIDGVLTATLEGDGATVTGTVITVDGKHLPIGGQ